MNRPAFILAALACVFALPVAHAAQPVGTIGQLNGMVLAVKPDGRPKILSAASRVETGDTLVSEADSYVRLVLDNGNEAILGPRTTLTVQRASPQESALTLVGGQLQVRAGARRPAGHRFTLQAGGTSVAAGVATFTISYSAPREAAVAARQSWLRSSLAAAGTGPQTDGGDHPVLRELFAQAVPPSPQAPPIPPPGSAPPGLHLAVIDGAIQLSNQGGAQTFNAGQFGYVRNNSTPPVLVPSNPILPFTPPPAFFSSNTPNNNQAGGPNAAIDCVVR